MLGEEEDDDGATGGGLPLPNGWTAFTSPEGWEYFFHAGTNVVQWKRPMG